MKNCLKEHGSAILTGIGCIGVIGTGVLAAVETPKALARLDEAKEQKDAPLTKWETFLNAAPAYIPAVGCAFATIACVLGAHILDKKKQKELIASYVALSESYRLFKEKTREVVGEEQYAEILDSYVNDDIKSRWADSCDKQLFYDDFLHSYFECTFEELQDVEAALNRELEELHYVTIDRLYYYLGLDIERIPIDASYFGWTWVDNSSNYIRLNFEQHQLDDGMVVNMLDIPTPPEYMEQLA